ncbi:hypothetical protein [Lactobacillus phage Satyr]|uniref:Uncharacterized protein n=2 Tax=Maenadvirus TaxID=2733162 RepID=A0A2K9V533_9CAUD|nr:hypothetical protein HOS71_gp022 [Lactobacillus phage Satyr]YP_009798691.1 hypothetical protein HOS85_gp021 [Lactobacillus phage Maenad]AUV57270.1 hypothetical protein [Lactobacillus phage Satyr]AVH85595.1 hypothetical protein [Lactobacillus phage Maenad]
MKYSEAKKEIETLSSKYSAYKDMDTESFNVYYKNGEVAYVRTNERYSVTVWFEKYFTKLPFSNKLYMILSELSMTPLDKRVEEKKYLVKALGMYLNIETNNNHPSMNTRDDCLEFKTNFTLNEIERLKQREDIALDWNKVKLEEVKQRTC